MLKAKDFASKYADRKISIMDGAGKLSSRGTIIGYFENFELILIERDGPCVMGKWRELPYKITSKRYINKQFTYAGFYALNQLKLESETTNE